MIRIAFVADTHADVASRWDEHCRIMGWLSENIASRNVDLVCHGGDVFDGQSNPTERAFVADWIKSITEFSPLCVVAGNHDKHLDTRYLQRLRTKLPIVAVEDPGVQVIAGVAVAMLPWPRKANLLAALGLPVGKEESGRIAVKALQDILTGLGAAMPDGVPRVLLSHSMITGSKTDSRQPIAGADMEVSLADLALSRAHLIVAGHVHAEQSFQFDDVPIIYPGCPYHRNYGEPGPTSYVIAEFEGDQLVGWSRVPVPARPMLLLEAKWDGHALVGPHRLQDVTGAEVRVRFSVPADEREAAEICAAEDRKVMLERGAALVKMDPQVETTTRARVPEVALVRTLPDKLDVLWTAKGIVPTSERRIGILSRLAILEEEVPVTASAGGAIRFDRIQGHHLWKFGDFDINLRELPGVVIAVTGTNGAGKTTFLEALNQVLFRVGPTRGPISKVAGAEDTWIRATVVNGNRYEITQTADALRGGGEASVVGSDGRAILDSAGIRPYMAWAKTHLPTPEVLYASQFIHQGSGGFLALGEADRKSVLLRALGIERLEKLAEIARKRATATEGKLGTLVERIADEKARGMDVATAQAELDAAVEASGNAGASLATAKADLARIVKEQERLVRLQQDAEETRARRSAIQQRLETARTKVVELARRRDECAGVVAKAADIRNAVERLGVIAQQVSEAQATQARVQAEADASEKEKATHEQAAQEARARSTAAAKRAKDRRDGLDVEIKTARKSLDEESEKLANNRMLLEHADEINEAVAKDHALAEEATRVSAEEAQAQRDLEHVLLDINTPAFQRQTVARSRKTSADGRVTAARKRLEDRPRIQQAADSLEKLQRALTIVEDSLAEAEAEHERLRGQTVAGAEERIAGLRGTLSDISGHLNGGIEEAQSLANLGLSRDDDAVRSASLIPLQVKDAAECVSRAKTAVQDARKGLEEAKALAGRAGEMSQAETELATAESDAREADAEIKAEQEAIDASQKRAIQLTADRKRAQERLAEIAQERSQEPLKTNAGRATKLANAQARVETLEPAVGKLSESVAHIEAAIVALPEVDPDVQAADLETSEAAAKASAAAERGGIARARFDGIAGALRYLANERARLEPTAARLSALTKAEALASDLDSQAAAAGSETASIEAELATVPDPGATVLPDTGAAEQAVAQAEFDAQGFRAAVAVAETKLQAARDREAKLQELVTERHGLEDELSDWVRLAQDLGRAGLQGLEIDAAGPSLTDMINDLLRFCFDSRWTVSVETARWNKDGDKQIEGCEIQVIDTKTGYDGPADALSGGEKVLVGEAISLAISLLSCKRAGIEGITLVRDEAGAALDPENAAVYVRMMRRAAEIVNADKVLFVSHQPDAVAEADSRIVIENYSIRAAA